MNLWSDNDMSKFNWKESFLRDVNVMREEGAQDEDYYSRNVPGGKRKITPVDAKAFFDA